MSFWWPVQLESSPTWVSITIPSVSRLASFSALVLSMAAALLPLRKARRGVVRCILKLLSVEAEASVEMNL